MRNRLSRDPHRPQYHFIPPANWMNDPNGLIQWNGNYHLFYQYNPKEAAFGLMHWGHAVSSDLVRWSDLPVALTPTLGTPDEHGCWSGCTVNHDGTPTVIYTGVREGVQLPCLATSDDDLVTWKKNRGNPVIASPPSDLDLMGFRDHSVWREGAYWYQIIGSGIRHVGGTALLYRSTDLIQWDYLLPLCVGDRRETGELWECPDLFPLGTEHVLMISPVPLRIALYFLGTYARHKYAPRTRGVIDYGGHYYAPQTMLDNRGRRLVWGWLWEGRSEEAQREAGWAGVMSLPRVLTLRPDGLLGQKPVPELEALRGEHRQWCDVMLTPDFSGLLAGVRGDAFEIFAQFQPGKADVLGIKVRCSPDGEEQTIVLFDMASQRLGIDRERSSLDPGAGREPHGGPIRVGPDDKLRLRVFLDRSVVEVFANDHMCVTSRIYPSRPDSLGLEVFAWGGEARLDVLDVWTMGSIWVGSA